MILNNSTVSGNTAFHAGGEIYNSDTVELNNSTVRNNTASQGGGIYNADGSVTLQNSILAGNTATEDIGEECQGPLSSLGYNLIGNTSDCAFTPTTGDLTNIDPQLGALTGSPSYHPLLFGSPAIDAGNPAGCTDSFGNLLATDQHGVPRMRRCDIGAYEYDGPFFQIFLPLAAKNS